ncbi:hypothetical protein JZ751_024841 [Albula glossodonta]|uniref:Uncharacterized protein n=1 Tax=Albula glossodonta TaxID=121402 RepID=A0A8T2PLS0_9TELE|nr:hypothetical protein JZ751_024841 [Albula glossodonta]
MTHGDGLADRGRWRNMGHGGRAACVHFNPSTCEQLCQADPRGMALETGQSTACPRTTDLLSFLRCIMHHSITRTAIIKHHRLSGPEGGSQSEICLLFPPPCFRILESSWLIGKKRHSSNLGSRLVSVSGLCSTLEGACFTPL